MRPRLTSPSGSGMLSHPTMQQQPYSFARLLLLVIGYNRPGALARLFQSLSRLAPPVAPVDLLVSIDGGGDPACVELAREFRWVHGGMRVEAHSRNLGLRTHVETAIDHVTDYDAVIVLEDDLSVSPWMFHYCREVLTAYGGDPRIAQISLYASDYNEFCGLPFTAVRGPGDVWLSRAPSSWGQIWTRDQWTDYRRWLRSGQEGHHLHLLPASARRWDPRSWKKSFFEYVVSSGLWTVHPYTSLSTNHGDAGTHFSHSVRDLEVPLEVSRRNYCFVPVPDILIRYDAWLEPMPDIVSDAAPDPSLITVDLYGIKTLADVNTPYLLSRKPCASPVRVYGSHLTPLELNVRLDIREATENPIFLGLTSDFKEGPVRHELFAAHVKRRLRKHLHESGYQQGQADLRKEPRFILGDAMMYVPSKLAALFRRRSPG